MKKALNAGVFVGPRMQAVSQGLTVTGGYVHEVFLEVDAVVQVRKAIGGMIKLDVDRSNAWSAFNGVRPKPSPAVRYT